jgi:hypothetical protein
MTLSLAFLAWRAFVVCLGNLCDETIAWWAREDSNLQPSGYERRAVIGKVSKNPRFGALPLA